MQGNEIPFSIIVPVYQAKSFLNACVDSILDQTFPSFQLLLIDDGSTDGSGEICDFYAAKDDRVKVVHMENAGVSNARNTGIEASSGEYLIFIDSDDWIDRDWLADIKLRAQDGCDIIAYDYYAHTGSDVRKRYFDYDGAVLFTADGKNADRQIKRLQKSILSPRLEPMMESLNTMGVPWGKAYRRELIQSSGIRFDISLMLNEDVVFNLECMNAASTLLYVPEAYYHYRKYESSSMKRIEKAADTALRQRAQIIRRLESMRSGFPGLQEAFFDKEVSLLRYCFALDADHRSYFGSLPLKLALFRKIRFSDRLRLIYYWFKSVFKSLIQGSRLSQKR